MIEPMLIDLIRCPVCASAEIDAGAKLAEIDRASWETMRGARITTEIAQLHRLSSAIVGPRHGKAIRVHVRPPSLDHSVFGQQPPRRLAPHRTHVSNLSRFPYR